MPKEREKEHLQMDTMLALPAKLMVTLSTLRSHGQKGTLTQRILYKTTCIKCRGMGPKGPGVDTQDNWLVLSRLVLMQVSLYFMAKCIDPQTACDLV